MAGNSNKRTRKTTKKPVAKVTENAVVEHPPIASSTTGNNPRLAYALVTLINEVKGLFPEVTYSALGYDGRNTALGVDFDTPTEQAGLPDLLNLIASDPRVRSVTRQSSSSTVVFLRSDPRTQDSRDPFDLNRAWLVLSEDEQSDDSPDAHDDALYEGVEFDLGEGDPDEH